ncbi:MAG: DUF721 domain-containing protein [Acidobacteria bacterium]|nr:DUF721 domain-containing protein [Acidobacteriota bacterium]
MERAARLFSKFPSARGVLTPEQLVMAAWPAAVGARLAARTRAVMVHKGRLLVEVEDELWRRNLAGLRNQILSNLAELLESATPEDIEFRVGIPRRPPQRAASTMSVQSPALSQDEADAIHDPGLRRIYINSRRKARAS